MVQVTANLVRSVFTMSENLGAPEDDDTSILKIYPTRATRNVRCFDCLRNLYDEGLCSVYAAMNFEGLYDEEPVPRCFVCFQGALTYGTNPRRSRDIENSAGMVAHTFCDDTTAWCMPPARPEPANQSAAPETAVPGPETTSTPTKEDSTTEIRDRSRSPRRMYRSPSMSVSSDDDSYAGSEDSDDYNLYEYTSSDEE